jgi:hypothetical protein
MVAILVLRAWSRCGAGTGWEITGRRLESVDAQAGGSAERMENRVHEEAERDAPRSGKL